ncbi:amidase [Salana multivorans]|uniref:Amidase n=1 Tax=Salana multivorans TaxID=120377 RepID=A0A3N2DBF2_9MICO|nr:amidase [Salana multivorans]ROR97042.1 amidase [Salana multivorans]
MADPIDIAQLTATEIAAAVRSGRLRAVEVAEASLAAAAGVGAELGAFARLTPELALAEAGAVDAAVARGDAAAAALRLAGVPCPIKDLNAVRGVQLTAGAAVLAAAPIVPDADDGTVVLLREAGTATIGKTATPEFGFPPYTEPRTGPGGAIVAARTPWDLTRGAGGSSGGAAASVAAGISPIAHASDGGGSIRIPAASCGIVGFKPSRGVVSSGPLGVDGPGLGTQGALARTVRDAAVALEVLARPWPGEVVASPALDGLGDAVELDRATLVDGLRGLRVGVLTDPVVAGDAVVHPEAVAAAERAADDLRSLGFDVATAPVPFTPQEWLAFMPLWSVGALTLPVPDEAEQLLEPLTRWLREVGRGVTGAQYALAVADAQRVARRMATAWAPFDVVVTPSLAGPPAPVGSIRDDADPEHDFEEQKRFTPWTSPANIAGRPSVSVPIHRAVLDGVELPFGAMLTGRIGEDRALMELARLLEIVDPWPMPPTVPVRGAGG